MTGLSRVHLPLLSLLAATTAGCGDSTSGGDNASSDSDPQSGTGADSGSDSSSDSAPGSSSDDGTDSGSGSISDTASSTRTDSKPLYEIPDATYVFDPYGTETLAAIGKVSHPELVPEQASRIAIFLSGNGAGAQDLQAEVFPQAAQFQANFDMSDQLQAGEVGIPILGLYEDHDNQVAFEIETDTGIFRGTLSVQTPAVSDPEDVDVTVYDPAALSPGWIWVDGRVYDNQGELRWKGESFHRRLANGNRLVGIDEVNWLGMTVVERSVPEGYALHHDATELPNGNILALVDKDSTTFINYDGVESHSRNDCIVELDAASSEIVNEWDLREYMDVDRSTVAVAAIDWLHPNGVDYDPHDDSVILSARYQGIVKITRGGIQGPTPNQGKELVWILAPQMDWGLGGWDGSGPVDPAGYLLDAVDSNGLPYGQSIQDNLAAPGPSEDEFHWVIGQHAARITSRTGERLTLITFDNQASFIFDGPGTVDNGVTMDTQGDLTNDRMNPPYSMIIEYEVDEADMTVRQAWGYGQGDNDLYGSRTCSVGFLASTRNRLMISTGFDSHDPVNNPRNPNVLEFTEDGVLVMHLDVTGANWLAINGGKVDLYHPET